MSGLLCPKLLMFGVFLFVDYTRVSAEEDLKEVIQVDDYAGVITNMRTRFKNICVYFLLPDYVTMDTAQTLTTLQRMTSEEDGLTSVVVRLPTSGVYEAFTCFRPLVVLPFYERDNVSLSAISVRGLAGSIWLQFLNPATSLEEFFQGMDVPFDSQVMTVQKSQGTLYLNEVYRIREDLPLYTVPFGTWNLKEGFEVNQLSLEERRNKLDGIVFEVVVTNEPPLVVVTGNGSNITVKGSIGNLFHELEHDLNYTTVYTVSPDGIFGAESDNGSWTGMVGMIDRKEVDMAVNAFVFTIQRMEVVDYTIPIFIKDYTIFIKVTAAMTNSSKFSAPFSNQLWLLIGMAIFVLGFTMATLMKIKHWYLEREDQVQVTRFSYFESVYCIFAIFLHQSCDVIPNPASCRVVFLTALIVSTVTLSAYSGVLISFLAVHNVELPFHDIAGLLKDGNYKIGQFNVPPVYSLSNFLENSGNPELQRLSVKIREEEHDDPPRSVLEGLNRVCSSQFAFFAPTEEALDLVDDIGCKLVAFTMVSAKVSQGIPMRKDSPYRSLFNQRLLKLRDGGVLEKLHADAWAWQFHRTDESSQTSLRDIASLLKLLLGGAVAAVVCLVVERRRLRGPHVLTAAAKTARDKINMNMAFENMYTYKVLDMLRGNTSTRR